MTHPPDLSGGSGFTFGDVVVAVYLAALLGERSAPGIESRLVYRVALEQANVGERVDDLIVDGRARDGSKMRLRAQNKREIRISAAAANTDFRDTIVRAWEMLNKADFREGVDRVALITGTVAASPRRAFQDICAWACVSESAESFAARFQPGAAGEQKRAICEAILKILNGIPGRAPNDGDAFRLLRHFILITLDLNYDGSTDQAHVIEQLRDGLLDRTEAGLLWNTLRSLARDGAGRAAEFTKESLITSLRGEFKLRNVEEVLARDIEKTVTRVAEKLEAGQEIDVGRLREIARNLLDAGSPPTLLPLFPGAPETTRRALAQLANLERTVSETRPAANDKEVGKPIAELLAATQLHLLMIAAPGSGKTHALWHLANAMLASDGLIPIFLPTGGFALWDDALRAIADVSGGTDAHVIVRDRRICLLLDGWSEFAQGAGSDERMRAMRVLSRTRIIANGRLGTTSDSTFHTWELDPLPTEAVRKAIRSAFPRSPSAEPSLIELLRLPLALSLFMLLGGLASNKGELLSRLHEQLSRALPEGFRRVLSAAVASVAVSGQGRSYTRFESELRARANRDGLPEPIKKLRKLGTIQDRSGTVAPIHDLYWSWLAGVGLLNEDWLQRSVRQLATRESYELALESGELPQPSVVRAASKMDITLAGLLDGYLDIGATPEDLTATLRSMFADRRLAVRCRAALAVFAKGDSGLLKSALQVLTELHNARIYVPSFDKVLNPRRLYPHRGILAQWAGSPGTDRIVDAIARRGDAVWGEWFEQLAASSELDRSFVLGAALACASQIPDWAVPHLISAVKAKPWEFRVVADRGTNTAFARWIAEHYEELIDPQDGGGWFHLNRILISCGDDQTFGLLLSRFAGMPSKAQELLEYAVVEKGEPWIARFQQIAFASGHATHHHRLAEAVSLGIDDTTARQWIANGPAVLGWRVLIARHGLAILPELIGALPASFADIHVMPALEAMCFLPDAPPSLTNELMRRFGSPMQPKATADVINALARIRSSGIAAIIRMISDFPFQLPTYHLAQALRILDEWQRENQVRFIVRSTSGETLFSEWILRVRLAQNRNDHMFRSALAGNGELGARLVLSEFRQDEGAVKDILEFAKPLTGYRKELFEFLIGNSNLSALVAKVFSGVFDTFPEDALSRMVIAPGIDFDALLRALATSPSTAHAAVHKTLIASFLARPFSIFDARELAKILKVYSNKEVVEMLKETITSMDDSAMWLVRESESARSELLIDESGSWLD